MRDISPRYSSKSSGLEWSPSFLLISDIWSNVGSWTAGDL